jgi:hypothetical protein
MTKLIASDKGLRGVDVGTKNGQKVKLNPNKQGVFEVNNPKLASQLKKEGFFEASLMGPTTNNENVGYNCTQCGFGSWFRKCSRCGHETLAHRDGEV